MEQSPKPTKTYSDKYYLKHRETKLYREKLRYYKRAYSHNDDLIDVMNNPDFTLKEKYEKAHFIIITQKKIDANNRKIERLKRANEKLLNRN